VPLGCLDVFWVLVCQFGGIGWQYWRGFSYEVGFMKVGWCIWENTPMKPVPLYWKVNGFYYKWTGSLG